MIIKTTRLIRHVQGDVPEGTILEAHSVRVGGVICEHPSGQGDFLVLDGMYAEETFNPFPWIEGRAFVKESE